VSALNAGCPAYAGQFCVFWHGRQFETNVVSSRFCCGCMHLTDRGDPSIMIKSANRLIVSIKSLLFFRYIPRIGIDCCRTEASVRSCSGLRILCMPSMGHFKDIDSDCAVGGSCRFLAVRLLGAYPSRETAAGRAWLDGFFPLGKVRGRQYVFPL